MFTCCNFVVVCDMFVTCCKFLFPYVIFCCYNVLSVRCGNSFFLLPFCDVSVIFNLPSSGRHPRRIICQCMRTGKDRKHEK